MFVKLSKIHEPGVLQFDDCINISASLDAKGCSGWLRSTITKVLQLLRLPSNLIGCMCAVRFQIIVVWKLQSPALAHEATSSDGTVAHPIVVAAAWVFHASSTRRSAAGVLMFASSLSVILHV